MKGIKLVRCNCNGRNGARARGCALAILGAVALVSVGFAQQARAQHGVTIGNQCESPRCVGNTVDCDIFLGHADFFGDTTRILEAFDIVDPEGAAIRVPATGNLDIIAVGGNTTAVVGGSPPVLIGPANSTLSGLPGNPNPGFVVLGFLDPDNDPRAYVIPADAPDPLDIMTLAIVQNLCDHPDTVGCSTLPFTVELPVATIVNPLPACHIEGPNVVCRESVAEYCGPPAMQAYNWSISDCGAAIIGPTDQQCVTVESGPIGACMLALTITDDNGCEGGSAKELRVGPPGDIYPGDGDGAVNISDLGELLSNYGTTGGATYGDGDIYPQGGDGAVDFQDLEAMLGVYGATCE